ncbi:MAG TPA: HdeA/HdeB family chaperone [Xanthobacteraceae bacterium]|nr:HdeA/HdeB family chaperone [Xanthobacteraceae bacterium]
MWRHCVLVAFAIVVQGLSVAGSAHAQESEIDCDSFLKNPDGSWTVIKKVFIPVQNVRVLEGTVFRPGTTFLGDDMTVRLSRACPNKQVAVPEPADAVQPQPPPGRVPLSKYADANGNIDVQRLTCGEIADASVEDSSFFLSWYSGWYYGNEKKRGINPARVRYVVRSVVDYCKSNRDRKLTDVMAFWLK